MRIIAYGNPVYDRITTLKSTRDDRVLSGCSTNAALALSKLGKEPILIGCVGDDYREKFLNDLTQYSVDAELLNSKETGGFSLNYYDEFGNRTLDVLGIADQIPEGAASEIKCDFIVLGPILGEISTALVKNIRELSAAPIILDPQGLLRSIEGESIVHQVQPDFLEIARIADIVKANEVETETVTGINPRKDPEKAVRELHRICGGVVISTMAEAGSIIFDGEKTYRIPAYETVALDPTGAGDTYMAGFIIGYLEDNKNLIKAGCMGSAVSSVMVENSGPDFPLTSDELYRRLNFLLEKGV